MVNGNTKQKQTFISLRGFLLTHKSKYYSSFIFAVSACTINLLHYRNTCSRVECCNFRCQ